MKKPESYLRTLLGDDRIVEVMGDTHDLHEVVAIPFSDLDTVLRDHVERMAAWRRNASICRDHLENAKQELEEIQKTRFLHYWATLEKQERDEMSRFLTEEGEDTDEFGRRLLSRRRVANGVKPVTRWRRNFSDDLVWSYVHSDTEVVDKKRSVRAWKREMDVINGVIETLDHRMRCISHLCARERNN